VILYLGGSFDSAFGLAQNDRYRRPPSVHKQAPINGAAGLGMTLFACPHSFVEDAPGDCGAVIPPA